MNSARLCKKRGALFKVNLIFFSHVLKVQLKKSFSESEFHAGSNYLSFVGKKREEAGKAKNRQGRREFILPESERFPLKSSEFLGHSSDTSSILISCEKHQQIQENILILANSRDILISANQTEKNRQVPRKTWCKIFVFFVEKGKKIDKKKEFTYF